MSPIRINWLILKDALLIAVMGQLVLTVAAHYVEVLSRFRLPLILLVTGLVTLYYGVSTNPSTAASAGMGGAIVGAVAALAGAGLGAVLGDVRTTAAVTTLLATGALGALVSAIGSVVGRKVFGA